MLDLMNIGAISLKVVPFDRSRSDESGGVFYFRIELLNVEMSGWLTTMSLFGIWYQSDTPSVVC